MSNRDFALPATKDGSSRSATDGGLCVVVVTDRQTGERYIHRDPDPWTALVRAATAAGFEFDDG